MEAVHLYSLYLVEHQPDMVLAYPPLSFQYCRPVFVRLWLSQRFHRVVCKTKYLVHEQTDPHALSNWKSDYRGSSHALRKTGHIFRKFPWSCSKCHLCFVFSGKQEMELFPCAKVVRYFLLHLSVCDWPSRR